LFLGWSEAHISVRNAAEAGDENEESDPAVEDNQGIDIEKMISILDANPKLLAKGRSFAVENPTDASKLIIRHTHNCFRQFSGLVMRNLLDENCGLERMLMDKSTAAEVTAEILKVCGRSLWTTFPCSFIEFAKYYYSTFNSRLFGSSSSKSDAWLDVGAVLPPAKFNKSDFVQAHCSNTYHIASCPGDAEGTHRI
jgi:hypothetical protein